ncbi:hypothetical protein MKY85_17595 [Paenibacillus sp. FSL R5-0749]|uniref:hypothetical protein n=1 Tax=Paenibacillus sp. FSL R5-0749 TaxID=2921657 RepID=UPI00315B00C7
MVISAVVDQIRNEINNFRSEQKEEDTIEFKITDVDFLSNIPLFVEVNKIVVIQIHVSFIYKKIGRDNYIEMAQKFVPSYMYPNKPSDHLLSITINTDDSERDMENCKRIVSSNFGRVTFATLPINLVNDLSVITYIRQISHDVLVQKRFLENI